MTRWMGDVRAYPSVVHLRVANYYLEKVKDRVLSPLLNSWTIEIYYTLCVL